MYRRLPGEQREEGDQQGLLRLPDRGRPAAGIGRDEAEEIWFKAVTSYVTTNTDYAGARKGTLSAACGLYGADPAQYKAVDRAGAAVNVK
ncbi:M4 family metallopeptidase [Streptomyces sp. NPDC056002]|uniref:M4 family metallopeptidase n=1 Tax=Streptomyces sp. NPDC056002 TaxID=3345675 RepID=UPI0035DF3D2D